MVAYWEIVKSDISRIVQDLADERDKREPDLDRINLKAKELLILVKLVQSHEGRENRPSQRYPSPTRGRRAHIRQGKQKAGKGVGR